MEELVLCTICIWFFKGRDRPKGYSVSQYGPRVIWGFVQPLGRGKGEEVQPRRVPESWPLNN